jgi:hypothetical protein
MAESHVLPPDREPDRIRFADRTWPLSIVVAVALVALTLGGLLGAVIADIADDGRGAEHRGRGAGEVGRTHPHGMPPGQMDRDDRERFKERMRERGPDN